MASSCWFLYLKKLFNNILLSRDFLFQILWLFYAIEFIIVQKPRRKFTEQISWDKPKAYIKIMKAKSLDIWGESVTLNELIVAQNMKSILQLVILNYQTQGSTWYCRNNFVVEEGVTSSCCTSNPGWSVPTCKRPLKWNRFQQPKWSTGHASANWFQVHLSPYWLHPSNLFD